MDTYHPETVFSSIDLSGRYAYFNQPGVTKWNLTRFAECLIPLVHEKEYRSIDLIKENINNFAEIYEKNWLDMMREKLGLFEEKENDNKLINDLLLWMNQNKADYTNTFCSLAKENILEDSLFKNKEFINWHQQWKHRLNMNKKPIKQSLNLMKKNNPLVIPRNHKVEEALKEATDNDNLKPFNKLLEILRKPYEDQSGIKIYQSLPLSNETVYKTYCGT